jgi:hypothetical protein
VNIQITDETKVSTRTDLLHAQGEVNLESPAMNCRVSMDGRSATDPATAAVTSTERYRVSLSRPLPIFELSSAVTYGGSTNTVRAAISRPLADHLTGEFDSVRGSDAAGVPTEQSLKLMYGFSF